MICKKIPNSKKSSTKSARASGLAEYITKPDLINNTEKCIFSESVNFLTHDLKSQTLEMIALSQEAVKSKDPLDHWVLSWKSHEKPTPAQAQEAAAIFIKQCGLTGHQYITGLHDDTDNLHLHIAVNRVHPETCKVIKINKGFDREAGQQAIAIIEKKQGWSVEKNARYQTNDKAELVIDLVTKRPEIVRQAKKQLEPTAKAQAMEIQTGEKSAQRIGIEQAAPLIAKATSWKELHIHMAAAGLEYRRDGSGAKVYVGDIAVKASDVDRKASLGNLQKRFGPYQPAQEIKPHEYYHHTQEPHPAAFRKDAGNSLRNLSKCNLAVLTHQGYTQRSRVLHIDARPSRRPADGLRRDTGRAANAPLTPQPMRQGQPGWNEYIAIRDTQKTAKTHDTIALQKRHSDQRSTLLIKLKTQRDEVLKGDWKNKGPERNALQSLLAPLQAAEKLELSDKHRAERKKLQAQYKALPLYKQWKEQPQIVSLHVLPVTQRSTATSTVVSTLRSLTSTLDARKHITYQLDGGDVFRDEGRTIAILDLESNAGIAAALAIAQQKFGNVLTLTGSDEFKKNAVAVAVSNNLSCKFADPALDKLRDVLQQQKYKAEQDAAQAERQLQRTKELTQAPVHSPIQQQTREAVPPVRINGHAEELPAPAPEAKQPEIKQSIELHEEVKTSKQQPDPQPDTKPKHATEIDYLDDIYKQLEIAAHTVSPYSPLHNLAIQATDEGHDKYIKSPILASNDQFIAVIINRQVQILKLEILNQNVEYEGHAEGVNRYAVNNEVRISPQSDGSIKRVVTEKREEMQTEKKKQRERDRGLGR